MRRDGERTGGRVGTRGPGAGESVRGGCAGWAWAGRLYSKHTLRCSGGCAHPHLTEKIQKNKNLVRSGVYGSVSLVV
jgi:hypothetical protein